MERHLSRKLLTSKSNSRCSPWNEIIHCLFFFRSWLLKYRFQLSYKPLPNVNFYFVAALSFICLFLLSLFEISRLQASLNYFFFWNLRYHLLKLVMKFENYLSRYDLLLKVGQLRSHCTWPFPYWTACTCRMRRYTTWIAFIWCAPSMPPVTISPCLITSPWRSYCWLLARCCNARFGSSCYFCWTSTRAAAMSAISLNAIFWLAQMLSLKIFTADRKSIFFS